MPERGVITDFDGTLVDTKEANAAAYLEAFRRVGLPFERERYDRAFGLAFDDMMGLVAPSADDATRAAVRQEKAAVYGDQLGLARVNTGLVRLLRAMREDGHRVALATTARRTNVLTALQHFGLTGLFDAVVAAEDVSRGKPDPEAYLLAAERLGVRPEGCIVFEDSSYGVTAAHAAGCAVIEVRL